MRKPHRIEWLGALGVLVTLQAHGEGALAITAFDADQVEVRQDGKYRTVACTTLGQPPIEVLERDKRNFLKIALPDGGTLWVNGGDVRTSDLDELRHNCSGLAMSEAGDRKQYGMRGVGEKCK